MSRPVGMEQDFESPNKRRNVGRTVLDSMCLVCSLSIPITKVFQKESAGFQYI